MTQNLPFSYGPFPKRSKQVAPSSESHYSDCRPWPLSAPLPVVVVVVVKVLKFTYHRSNFNAYLYIIVI